MPNEIEWIQADLNAPLPCPDASFDAIISTEVIEHLENPRAVFREFSRLLRPGGHLLLTTPNQESIRSLASLIVRGHHVAFLDESYPAHLTALVRRDMERLCLEARLRAAAVLVHRFRRRAQMDLGDLAVSQLRSAARDGCSATTWYRWPREPDSPPRGSRRTRNGLGRVPASDLSGRRPDYRAGTV